MSFNKRFILFVIAYTAGIAVMVINRNQTYELGILAATLVGLCFFALFNALYHRWV